MGEAKRRGSREKRVADALVLRKLEEDTAELERLLAKQNLTPEERARAHKAQLMLAAMLGIINQ